MSDLAQNRKYLTQCKQDLKVAKKGGEPKELSLALANVGYALCINNQKEKGMKYFDKAEVLAGSEVSDISVLAHGLGLRALVYQESKRLPHAFRTAGKLLFIAEEEGNDQVLCDAHTSQGHILLKSGEISEAFTRFQKAEKIAQEIGDDKRLMRINGAMANLSLSVPSLEKAQAYYQKAISLARDTDEQEAEKGYLGNLGSISAWQGEHEKAVEAFQELLPYYQSKEQKDRIIQVLNKLVQSYNELEENEQVFNFAFQGLELLDNQSNDLVFDFLEAVIMAYYREDKMQEAHNMISEAITLARSRGDQERELEFLMSLGESFVASDMLNRALDIYQDALRGAKELDRKYYQAYLMGRIGYVMAELGELEEAVEKHQRSIELAEKQHLAELEGDQRSMLAMAHVDLEDLDKAKEQAEKAIEVYQQAKLDEGIKKAQHVLNAIDRKITN